MDQPLDQRRDAFVITTGQGANGVTFNDVWSFDLNFNQWSRVDVTGTPPTARFGAAGGIDVQWRSDQTHVVNHLIVTHGNSTDKALDDTFVLSLAGNTFDRNLTATWTQLPITSTARPSGRALMSSTVINSQLLVMHGGCADASGGCPTNEAWTLKMEVPNPNQPPTGGSWSPIQSAACPGNRTLGSMIFNPNPTIPSQVVLYGGVYGDYDGPVGQVATLDSAGNWLAVLPALNPNTAKFPLPRRGGGFVSNFGAATDSGTPSHDMYLVAGTLVDENRDSNEVWVLREIPASTTLAGSAAPTPSLLPCPDVSKFIQGGGGRRDPRGGRFSEGDQTNARGFDTFILIHGLLMALAWGFIIPFGVLSVRHLSPLSENFIYLHGIGQACGVMMALGIIVLAGGAFQPLNAFFKPEPAEDELQSKDEVTMPHLASSVILPGSSLGRTGPEDSFAGTNSISLIQSPSAPASLQINTQFQQANSQETLQSATSGTTYESEQTSSAQPHTGSQIGSPTGYGTGSVVGSGASPAGAFNQPISPAMTMQKSVLSSTMTARDAKHTSTWFKIHKGVGRLTALLGLINVALGVSQREDTSRRLLIPYIVWLVVVVIIFMALEWFMYVRGDERSLVYWMYARLGIDAGKSMAGTSLGRQSKLSAVDQMTQQRAFYMNGNPTTSSQDIAFASRMSSAPGTPVDERRFSGFFTASQNGAVPIVTGAPPSPMHPPSMSSSVMMPPQMSAVANGRPHSMPPMLPTMMLVNPDGYGTPPANFTYTYYSNGSNPSLVGPGLATMNGQLYQQFNTDPAISRSASNPDLAYTTTQAPLPSNGFATGGFPNGAGAGGRRASDVSPRRISAHIQ
ncbi:hypothetical protein HK102_013153, partial [Quaeritorhiza haematococci]